MARVTAALSTWLGEQKPLVPGEPAASVVQPGWFRGRGVAVRKSPGHLSFVPYLPSAFMLMKRLMQVRSKMAVVAAATVALTTVACVDSTTPLPPSAVIKFLNLSSISADAFVDFRAGSGLVVQGQAFPTGSEARLSDALSGQAFSVRRTGDTTTLVSKVLTFGIDSTYNAIFLPQLTSGYDLIFIRDTIKASTTVAKFQFAHYAYINRAENVNVFVSPKGTVNPTIDQRVAANVAYGQLTSNIEIPVDTSVKTLIVQRASDNTELFHADSLAHNANARYLLLMGDQKGTAKPRAYVVPVE